MSEPVTRQTLIEWLASASVAGHLGLFVGTGFSIAATGGCAPSFETLLAKVALHFGGHLDLSAKQYRLKSAPQIASQLLRECRERSNPPAAADDQFRNCIATICNLQPTDITGKDLSEALKSVRPSWVITTNYDLILESLLEDAISVLPSQTFLPNAERVPIYHMHGHRHQPSSIKITEEDYVSLLGPINYPRLKLPLLFTESTTLLLGYAFGDINVRAAVDMSKSFKGEQDLIPEEPKGLVIQALFRECPTADPYRGEDGEWVIEINDIASFLKEVGAERARLIDKVNDLKHSIEQFLANADYAKSLAGGGNTLEAFSAIISKGLKHSQSDRVITFMETSLSPIWGYARLPGGFHFYEQYLNIILKLLLHLDIHTAPPKIFSYFAEALNRVGWYIDPKKPLGSSYAATDLWMKEGPKLHPSLLKELRSYADANSRNGLQFLLKYIGH